MAAHEFWKDLFPVAGIQATTSVHARVVTKRGKPFLLLPQERRAAATTLSLYPAQTPKARAARTLLRWFVRLGLPWGTRTTRFGVPGQDGFVEFLGSLLDGPHSGLPMLGILAGNPASDGQRFLLLVFDGAGTPAAVAKAGLTPRAKSLVEAEERFLATVPSAIPGVPRLRGSCRLERLTALALDYYPGHSPRPSDAASLPALLSAWVDPQRTISLRETPDWGRLENAVAGNKSLAELTSALGSRKVHPAIQQGDFAPWNIKVSAAGDWTVLDWERGELLGIPGWDWFHYVIQPAILVDHLPTPEVLQRVNALLASAAFQAYSHRAGITGFQRDLVAAYLLHAVAVIRPSEGLAATQALLHAYWPGSGNWEAPRP